MTSLQLDDKLLNALESGDFQTALPLLPKDGPSTTYGPEGFTPLHYASRHGETQVTILLITQYHYSFKSTSIQGQTPAHVAAEYGHVDILKAMVECISVRGSSNTYDILSLGDKVGNTLLHTASAFGHIPVVKYLIKKLQCSPLCVNLQLETPLHLAAENGHLDVIKYLVGEVGCPVSPVDEHGGTPLYTAAGHGQLEVVKYLVEVKACNPNVCTTERLEREWKGIMLNFAPGRTPLHTASREGHLNVVNYLVSVLNCDPSCRDEDGGTPLHLASQYGHLDIVKFLIIVCHCDPNAAKNNGHTPLHSACCLGSLDSVQFLTDSGCDPMAEDHWGRTPLHYSSLEGHLHIVQYLITEHKVVTSCQDQNGESPLHFASQNGHLQVVCFLTEHGCDLLARNKSANTPLNSAALNGRLNVLKFFITEKGCDPMVRGKWNRTLLHSASQEGHLDIVEYLFSKHQVDPSCRGKKGGTPLHLAAKYGHVEVVKFLVEKAHCDPFQQVVVALNKFSPMLLAVKYHRGDVLSYLYSKGVPIPKSFITTKPQLDVRVSIYCIGNQSMGKSTLVKALSSRESLYVLRKVTGVPPETAGIIPLEFNSGVYGNVTLYDFAGHTEYYASHELVFENDSHPVILLIVNTSKDNEKISKMLKFWKQFLTGVVSASNCRVRVIIVGSHADLVSSNHKGKKLLLLKYFESAPQIEVVDSVLLDCRKPSSSGMSQLRSLLKDTCKKVRIELQFDYEKGIILSEFIKRHLHNEVVLNMYELHSKIEKSPEPDLAPLRSFDSVYQTCESLSISGHLLLFEDCEARKDSWVILRKEVILSQVHGILKHLKDDPYNWLGVVPFSCIERLLQECAQTLSPDVAIRYMKRMMICSEIDQQALTLIKNPNPRQGLAHVNEKHFFFPSLVRVERPSWLLNGTEHKYQHTSVFYLKCTGPDQFFTPRFLQMLLIQLTCQFALRINEGLPGQDEAETEGCHIWKNGIRWLDPHGIEAIVQVGDESKSLILILRTLPTVNLPCVCLRSALIHDILKIKRKLCGEMKIDEYFVHPNYLEQPAPLVQENPPVAVLIPLSKVANALLQNDRRIITDQLSHKEPFLLIDDLLLFEPYQNIEGELLLVLYEPQNEHQVIQHPLLEKLAEALRAYWENVAIILKVSQATIADLRTKNYLDDMKKCLKILIEWSGGKGTWGALHRDLDQYSVFRGRCWLESCQEMKKLQQKPVFESPNPAESHQSSPNPAHNLPTDSHISTQPAMELTDASRLGIESLLEVRTELEVTAISCNPTNLGLALGLRYDTTLMEIKAGNQSHQFTEIIAAWLRGMDQAGTPSWKSLTKALTMPDVGCPSIASRIAENHLSDSVSSTSVTAYHFFEAEIQKIDNSSLNNSSLRDVKHSVWNVGHLWFHLGLVFGLNYVTLKSIEIEHHQISDCMTETLHSWLCLKDQVEKQGRPSWRTLVRALAHPLVNELQLAKDLAETHKIHVEESGNAATAVQLSSSDPSNAPPSHSPASSM